MILTIVPAAKFIARVKAEITPVYTPKFRAVKYNEVGKNAIPHKYLVKGLLVAGEKSILAGESQAGKSFLATDLCMSGGRGAPWQGKEIAEPFGVVYIAAESASGVVNLRIPAYTKHFDMDPAEDLPIVFVTQPPDLFSSDDDTKALVADIKAWAQSFKAPLGLVVVDTFSAATPGADEIKSADVSRILRNIDTIREQTGAHVMVVHHMNAEGSKVRGHSSMVANFDTVLVVAKTEEHDKPESGKPHQVRTMTTLKQKDGAAGYLRKFILRVVDLGFDPEGEPITSCVCDLPDNITGEDLTTKWREPGFYQIPKLRGDYGTVGFTALVTALKLHGRRPPPHVDRIPLDASAVTVGDWLNEWLSAADFKEEEREALKERLRGQRKGLVARLMRDNIIDKQGDWVWRTKRKVQGYDKPGNRSLNPGGYASAETKTGAADAPHPVDKEPFEFSF